MNREQARLTVERRAVIEALSVVEEEVGSLDDLIPFDDRNLPLDREEERQQDEDQREDDGLEENEEDDD